MARIKRRTARIYYGVTNGMRLYWTVRVTDAKRQVRINGSLADAMAGRAGTTIGCHLSNCAKRNAEVFPHPVILPSFTKTTALIVDKVKNGEAVHAVKYEHSYGTLVDLNDRDASRDFVRKHPELAEREFVLRVPKKRPIGSQAGSGVAEGMETGQRRRPAVLRGALERARKAGLITAELFAE